MGLLAFERAAHGEDAAVRYAVTGNRSILLIGAIVGAATLLFFLLVCILKRSFSFIPQLLFAFAIFLALFSTYLLYGFTAFPYLLLGIRRFSMGFILVAAALYLPKQIKKIPSCTSPAPRRPPQKHGALSPVFRAKKRSGRAAPFFSAEAPRSQE